MGDKREGGGPWPTGIPAGLLPGLGGKELGQIERYSVETRLRSGKALYYQGDEASSAYLLLSGRIRPLRLKGSSSVPLAAALPGAWLCLPEALLGLPCLVDALALEACELRRFGSFNLAALRKESWFKDLLGDRLASDCYALYRQLEASSATERVALALAACCAGRASGAGATLRVELNQGALAESLGMTRETVNRCLKRLEAAGLLETERGCVLVYDLAALRDWED